MTTSIQKEHLYISSLIDFTISILVGATGFLINWKHLQGMKEDERMRSPGEAPSIINNVLITYTKVLMIITPYYLFLNWFLNEEFFDIPEWLQYLLCYDQYVSTFFRVYVSFNSFVIATMRYTFIVQHDGVLLFGKDKTKKLFYHGSYVVPIVIVFLNSFTLPVPENIQNPAQIICNALHHESLNITCKDNNCIPAQYSPLLSFAHNYIHADAIKYVGSFLKILVVTLLSNVAEGILYWRTFTFIKR